jgi:hypothetical protein
VYVHAAGVAVSPWSGGGVKFMLFLKRGKLRAEERKVVLGIRAYVYIYTKNECGLGK